MRVEVIPRPAGRPGAPEFDPSTGTLLATAEDIERLAALPSERGALRELESAGAIVAGRPHPALRGALAAIVAPRRSLVVERGDGVGRAWIGETAAALALPAGEGRLALTAVPAARAVEAIAAACGLDSSRRPPPGDPIRLSAGELARRLAGTARAVPGLGAPATAHWRVVAADRSPPTAVEVLDTEAGAWLLVPDGADVALRPASGAEILELLWDDDRP